VVIGATSAESVITGETAVATMTAAGIRIRT
jgi:hypothetical protein